MIFKRPGFVIGGIGGDSGKTFVSCGIVSELKNRGYKLSVFKKGPDYIDPAWLKLASGATVRNLDTYLMGNDDVKLSLIKNSENSDITVIEGNRGLYDGFDSAGTHSTAELAKLLKLPVILVLNVTKMTRTASAIVLGCLNLEPDVNINGVILNCVAGKRHEKILVESIESVTGIPVIGTIQKLKETDILPSRHLGLVTPSEFSAANSSIEFIRNIMNDNVDFDKLLSIAVSVNSIDYEIKGNSKLSDGIGLKLGYFNDRAFSFYYPENLEALAERGVELISISSISDNELPDIDGLYIGGGFPETNIVEISSNRNLMDDVKKKSELGLPVYAECGGLIYLAESIEFNGKPNPMAGVFPVRIKMEKEPQGHGEIWP